MTTRIAVRNLEKTFALSSHVGRPVSLFEALRSGSTQAPTRRQVHALKGLTFTIEEGERVGIIGRNGAGKSTLLSILAGVASATAGDVEVEGHVHAMLTIGAVLNDEATGRENVLLDAAIQNSAEGRLAERIGEIIDFTELADFIDQPVRTYSSGMKARLAFAMGAFVDPEILIIDETLSVGDAFFVRKAERKIREITSKGKISILVSHSLSAIREMTNRCIWIDQGRIVGDGHPDVVTEEYLKSVERGGAEQSAAAGKRIAAVALGWRQDCFSDLEAFQAGVPAGAKWRAFQPVDIAVSGEVPADAVDASLQLVVTGAGDAILSRQAVAGCGGLAAGAPFSGTLALNPFILGVGRYRLEVHLVDQRGLVDAAALVFEVIDEAGQYGGEPRLFLPPKISVRAEQAPAELDRGASL